MIPQQPWPQPGCRTHPEGSVLGRIAIEWYLRVMIRSTAARCAWCGQKFASPGGPGRPAKYCRRSHRQRAYESRRIAAERGLAPDEVLLTVDAWQSIRDTLYTLEAAAQDAVADAQLATSVAELRRVALDLAGTVSRAAAVSAEPRAIGE